MAAAEDPKEAYSYREIKVILVRRGLILFFHYVSEVDNTEHTFVLLTRWLTHMGKGGGMGGGIPPCMWSNLM